MFVVLVLGLVGAWSAPATSAATGVRSSREDLRAARAELHELDLELSLAAERLHESKVLMSTLRKQLDEAHDRSAEADAQAAETADAFDSVVRWAYETGASSQLAVLGLGSVEDLSAGVDFLRAMASNQAQVAASADEARERADEAAGQSASLEAAVGRTLDAQRAAGRDLNAAAERQKELIVELEQRLHRQITMAIADRRAAEAAAQAEQEAQRKAKEHAEQQNPPTDEPAPGPTTGPLPGPSEPIPTTGEIVDLITGLWGTGYDGQVARCVAWRESRYQPTARNSSSGASGLFQLMPFWWDGNSEFGWRFDPYDAQANAVHAHLIWKAYGWEPWTTGHLCV